MSVKNNKGLVFRGSMINCVTPDSCGIDEISIVVRCAVALALAVVLGIAVPCNEHTVNPPQ